MKKINKIQKTYFYDHVESVVCDLCKKEYKGSRWEADAFEVLETTVSIKTGYSYPEGGSGAERSFDICPDCFEDVLIPFIKSGDSEITYKEWET